MSERYPGDPVGRQPVHTVYGGAHLFRADTARRLGDRALAALRAYAPDSAALADAVGLAPELRETVYERVVGKLEAEPVEDFRIDFEDGYGNRPDDEEDASAAAAAGEVAAAMAAGTLPPFIGIRIKPFSAALRARAERTLKIFLRTLVESGADGLPGNFVVTFPKVFEPREVEALGDVLADIEGSLGLQPGAVKIELMVELPQAIIGPAGTSPLLALVDAAGGRCVAAHFGVYDYTAAIGITAEHQSMVHPACDFARHMMQVALAGTGVMISDGATNVIPVIVHQPGADGELTAAQADANRAAIWRAWRLHYEHVRHSLRHAYYQGWDLNPAQLPTRYAAVYAFFLESLPSAGRRLRNFVEAAAQATLEGDVFDDAATGQALLNVFLRGMSCGAITEREATATGLSVEELRRRSFLEILQARRRQGAAEA